MSVEEVLAELRRDGTAPPVRTASGQVMVARNGLFVDVTMTLEEAFDSSLHPHFSGMKPLTGQTAEEHQQIFMDEVKRKMKEQRMAAEPAQLQSSPPTHWR